MHTHQPEVIIGAYMCPWTTVEFDGALSRIFAQDYDLLAPAIDIFTPLIYTHKSGRPARWGREFLENASGFIPPDHPVQLILDMLDYPDSLLETASSSHPTWGFQMFAGAEIFQDAKKVEIFQGAVEQIRNNLDQ